MKSFQRSYNKLYKLFSSNFPGTLVRANASPHKNTAVKVATRISLAGESVLQSELQSELNLFGLAHV